MLSHLIVRFHRALSRTSVNQALYHEFSEDFLGESIQLLVTLIGFALRALFGKLRLFIVAALANDGGAVGTTGQCNEACLVADKTAQVFRGHVELIDERSSYITSMLFCDG